MQQRFDILFSPIWPAWLIAAGLALALALVFLLARAGTPKTGLLLRALAAIVIAAMLMNPQLRKQETQPLADIAVIVADHSASQKLDNRLARTRNASRQLRDRLTRLPATEVRVHTLPADGGENGTRLIAALKQALSDIPPERFAGAFLLTDGQVHDMPAKAAQALPQDYRAPVHVLLTGRRNERDRWIGIVRAGRYGIIGQKLEFHFRVEETPASKAPGRVRVRVRLNGKPWRQLKVAVGRTVKLRLPVKHAGQNVVELIADAMPGKEPELSLRNNRVVHVFKGVRDSLRVLLISGKPHPGERVWRSLLKSDPMVELVHFTILRPPEKQDGTPIRELALIAFPTYELFVEKLRRFDLIIFDRYMRRSILPPEYLQNITDYVRAGGAVLMSTGPEFAEEDSLYYTPLADLLPFTPTGRIIETPFRPRLTPLGLRHPLSAGLGQHAVDETPPWGHWYRVVDVEPGGDRAGEEIGASGHSVGAGAETAARDERVQVLMRGPENAPLLVLTRHGEGRVAALLSDHVWLWARRHDGGGPHVELIRRLAHWLMKEPDLEEEQLGAGMKGLDLLITRRTLRDTAPPLVVTTPDGRTLRPSWRPLKPGVFTALVRQPAPGLYHLRSGELSRVFPVGAADVPEFRRIVATEKILAPLAAATGGAVRWIAPGRGERVSVPAITKVRMGATAAGNGWLGIVHKGAAKVLAVRHYPLFAGLFALTFILLLLGLAWRLESR